VARNRKRRNDRRSGRPADARPGVATAGTAGAEGAPDPIEHATPDVELAQAQLAFGRPGVPVDEDAAGNGGSLPEEDFDVEDADDELAPRSGGESGAGGNGGGTRVSRRATGGGGDGSGGALTPAADRSPTPRASAPTRLVHFIQGCWRELQRVQWPDRRQVMQATGVVIGFVIVAGVFLGVSDFVAGKVVNFLLK
jgi:preprotein translocase subunit SecE